MPKQVSIMSVIKIMNISHPEACFHLRYFLIMWNIHGISFIIRKFGELLLKYICLENVVISLLHFGYIHTYIVYSTYHLACAIKMGMLLAMRIIFLSASNTNYKCEYYP